VSEKYGTVEQAMEIGLFGRKRLYQLIAEGVVIALRDGKKTVIDLDSVRCRFEKLPRATIRPVKNLRGWVDPASPDQPAKGQIVPAGKGAAR
jgi:hypothetical protein